MIYKKLPADLLDEMGGYHEKHMNTMTKYNLTSKSDIAAELGHRDFEIDQLKKLANRIFVLNENLYYAIESGDKEKIDLAMSKVSENMKDINKPEELEK